MTTRMTRNQIKSNGVDRSLPGTTPRRRRPISGHGGRSIVLGLLAVVALMLAGCGSDGDPSSGMSSSEDETKAGGGHLAVADASDSALAADATDVAVVKVLSTPGLGRVIVDAEGMTLYDSHGDNPMIYQFNQPPAPSCYGACAEAWPPLLTTASPKAIEGADADLLGTIERKDGAKQVTYDGHPLYTFAEDTEPGEANGDDAVRFGEAWHALEPDGEEPAD